MRRDLRGDTPPNGIPADLSLLNAGVSGPIQKRSMPTEAEPNDIRPWVPSTPATPRSLDIAIPDAEAHAQPICTLGRDFPGPPCPVGRAESLVRHGAGRFAGE